MTTKLPSGQNSTDDVDSNSLISDLQSIRSNSKSEDKIVRMNQKLNKLMFENDYLKETLNRMQFTDTSKLESKLRDTQMDLDSLRDRNREYREKIQSLETELTLLRPLALIQKSSLIKESRETTDVDDMQTVTTNNSSINSNTISIARYNSLKTLAKSYEKKIQKLQVYTMLV